jgi:hypothetical protein
MNNTGGVINLTDGGTVNVAAFVMNCDHAPLWMPEQDVTDHYAHAGMVFGFGVVTQGRYGPWACGVLRPDITAEQLTVLQGMGQLSGDWREGDLYAVQAVSRAGFPKTRPLAASAAEGCSCGTSLAVLDAVGTDFVGLEAKIDLLLSRTAWMDSQAAEFYAHKIGL